MTSGLLQKFKTPTNARDTHDPVGKVKRPLEQARPANLQEAYNSMNRASVMNYMAGATFTFDEVNPAKDSTANVFKTYI